MILNACDANAGSTQPNTGDWQPIATLQNAALAYVKRHHLGSSGRLEFRVRALDKRLRLARCDKPLETFAPSTTSPGATQIVGVRCNGSKPWKVYVQVGTALFRKVVVATRPLRKGAVVSSSDFRMEERDVTRLQNRYLTDPNQLEGQVLKRDLPDQAIIGPHALGSQTIIKRGQSITLIARNSSLNVRMRGEALGNAAKNERVRVKNLSSERVVEGVALSNQIVLVDH